MINAKCYVMWYDYITNHFKRIQKSYKNIYVKMEKLPQNFTLNSEIFVKDSLCSFEHLTLKLLADTILDINETAVPVAVDFFYWIYNQQSELVIL
jgi:hypothetical protein